MEPLGMTILNGLREFEGYEFGRRLAYVGDGVGIFAGEPAGVAGLEVSGQRVGVGERVFYRLFDIVTGSVFSKIEIADGYQEVGAGAVHGSRGAGLEFEFGDADVVFYEEDLLGASGEDFEAAALIPFGCGVPERFVPGGF